MGNAKLVHVSGEIELAELAATDGESGWDVGHLMQETGHISEHDMFNTFNMGVGMVLTVPAAQADKALEILHANGEPEAYKLGVIAEGDGVELC